MPSFYDSTYVGKKIREFKEWVQIPAYENVIETLVSKSLENNLDLHFCDGNYSRIVKTSQGNRYIEIKKEPLLGSRKEVAFDIMHELGHYFDPIELAQDESNKKEREERAWKIADQEFDGFPNIQDDKQEYEAYKSACLFSYSNQQCE